MRIRFKRCLSLCLSLCMLVVAMPPISLAEDGDAPIRTPEPSAAVETTSPAAETTSAASAAAPAAAETTPAAAETTPNAAETTPAAAETTPTAAETTPAAAETTPAAAETTPTAAEATTAPAPVIVALEGAPATLEAIYGCDEDELDLPESLTAVYSDESRAKLSVGWVCISDGLGGTAYDGECENYEDARFTFEARLPEGALCAEGLTLPRVQVQLVLPDNSNISTYDGDAPIVVGGISISNSEGVLSYTCRSDVGYEIGQRWYRGDELISSDQTYTLTMDDMKAGATIKLFVDMSTEEYPFVLTAEYSIAGNNNDWSYNTDTKTLTIKSDNGHKSTDFPFTDWPSVENVVIDENVEVTGLYVSVSGNVTVGSGAYVGSSSIECNTLIVNSLGTINTTTINAQNADISGTVELGLTVSVYDTAGYEDNKMFFVNYSENQNLYALLDEKASDLLTQLGDYVWTRNNSCVSPDANLELSMQGATFVAVALPALKVTYNGAELAKDGATRNSLPIGSTLSAVPDPALGGFNPSDYTWKIGDATIGSGASLTIPETITVDGVRESLALRSGDLTCTAKYGEKTLNSPSYPVRLELVLNPEPTLVSSTETEEKTVYTTATELSFSPGAEALKAQYGLSDVKYAWGRSEADVASPVDGAGATYTLTPDDLIGGEKTIYGAMFLYKGEECKQYVASYTIPANNEWRLEKVGSSIDHDLTFFGDYNEATTAFPVSVVSDISPSCQRVYVNSGVTVSGANLVCYNLEVVIEGSFSGGSIVCGDITVNYNNTDSNPGKVSNCTITCDNMTVGHCGTVSGSKIDCGSQDLIIKDNGTASDCTITCGNMIVYGGGMVSGGSIECRQILTIKEYASVTRLTKLSYGTLSKNSNSTLSVMAHIEGIPELVELTCGENLIDELNAAAGITGEGKIWYIKNVDDTYDAIAASDTVTGLHCGLTFECMDAPTLSLLDVNAGGTLHVGDSIAITTANVPEGVSVALAYKYGDNFLYYVGETPSRGRDSTYFVILPATYGLGNMCLAGGFELYACVRSRGNEVVGSDPVNVTILPRDGSITKTGTAGMHEVDDKLSFALPDGESFARPYCLDVLSTEWTVGNAPVTAETDGSLKLSLGLLGSCSEARTVSYTVRLKNPATMAEFTVSATYKLPANEVWTYDADSETLTIIGDYDGTKTDNPYPLPALSGRDSVIIEEGASLRGVTSLSCKELTNYGTIGSPDGGIHLKYASVLSNYGKISYCGISSYNDSAVCNEQDGEISNCAFYVRIENCGEISGSMLEKAVTNRQGGTIHDCSTVDGTPVHNIGTIYDCPFGETTLMYNLQGGTIYGSTFGNNSRVVKNEGEIHVPLTVNGTDYTSTPTSGVKFLYGESTLAALKAQYESVHGAGSAANFVWLDADGNELTDQTLGLYGNSFTCLGTLSCSIDAPTGYYVDSTLYANIALETEIEGVTTSYEWLDRYNSSLDKNRPLKLIESYANHSISLQVTVTLPGNKGSVRRTVGSDIINSPAYTVVIDYENDELVIKLRDTSKQIDKVSAELKDIVIYGSKDGDGNWIVPLDGAGKGKFFVFLKFYDALLPYNPVGPNDLKLTRADAAEEVRVSVPESGDPREVTLSWDSDATLEFRDSITGASFGKLNSGDTISIPAGADVALSVRTPGSNDARVLPSRWSDVATIKASEWIYLNVASRHSLSSKDTLFWGEVLEIDATAGATLTWKINGQDVEAPALVDGTYTIPEGATSLSITATDGSGNSITRELSVRSPISMQLDYDKEALILKLDGDFDRITIAPLTITGNSESGESVDPADREEHEMTVYPESSPKPLTITMEYGGNTYQSQMILPARFTGSADFGSISLSDYSPVFEPVACGWDVHFATTDGEGAVYAALKLVDSSGNEIACMKGVTDAWVPAEGVYLNGDRFYSVYAQQYSVDAAGRQDTFTSEWFDTGLRFNPGEVNLSTSEPLLGDTVTAEMPAGVANMPEIYGKLRWKWYFVDESGVRKEITGADSASFMILQGSGYENCSLRVELMYKRGENDFRVIGYAETEAIPEARIILTRKNGEESEELETDDNGSYIAYLGDVIYAEVENVSEEFLKDASVNWNCMCGDQAKLFEGSLTVDDGVLARSFASIDADMWNSASQQIALNCRVNFYIAPAPEVTIDYENETLVAAQPEKPLPEVYALCVDRGVGDHVFSSGVVDNKYTVPIASVKPTWPNNADHTVWVYWADETDPIFSPQSAKATFTIPARPTVQMPTITNAAYAITVKGVSTQDYNFRLTAENATSPDADAVATPSDVNGDVRFTGLEANTTYRLWMQTKATDSAFRSAWISDTVKTGSGNEVTPSLTSPTFDPDGFALYEDDLKPLLKLRFVNSPLILLGFRPTDVTLTRADGKPFPITEAGTYPLKLTLNGALTDNNRLTTETVTLTVNPYTVADYRFSSEKTYTGAVIDPYDFELKVNNIALTDKDYTITVADGKTLYNADTYTATITFKGNYTSKNVETVTPVIWPFTLRATAEPQTREYDGTTTVECTATWDNCAPFAGDDVAVKASGAMADKNAGADKAVEITLSLDGAQSDNYVLESDALTDSVDIAPRKVTVNPETPADFAYNGATGVPLTGQGWTLDGAVSGDDVRVNATNARASVESPNAGENKAVSFSGWTLDGADKANYTVSGVAARTVTITKAPAPKIKWPTAGDITYGQSLGDSTLSHIRDDHGSFAWERPDYVPEADDDVAYNMVYTPDDADNYDYSRTELLLSVAIVVNKAQAVIDTSGVQTQYVYTGALQSVNSGAKLNHAECELKYSNNSFTTVAEGDGLQVKITAAETRNYLAAEATATIHVARAEAPKLVLPAAAKLIYGQTLSESALTGSEDAPGSFAWEDGSLRPGAGLNSCNVVFTPDDPDNYAWTQEMLVRRIEVIVEPKGATLTVENATKTYGDADPAAKVSTSGLLEGDALAYSLSRRSGEGVGQYAYELKPGDNPNYVLDALLGTLTITSRDIADAAVSVSGVGAQVYTGAELRPALTLRFGGATLAKGTDYELSYSNNINPGRATITVTGKGNFSGRRSVHFTINEAPAATPAPSIAPISDAELQEYLNDMVSLVFDAAYNPVDYEQIPVLVSGETEENTLLICASQEEDGEVAQRSLILNAAQLVELQQAMPENKIGKLAFENGSAAASMDVAELTGGNVAKLMALVLSGEEITDEILQGDWSAVEEPALSTAAYERFNLEVRIAPVALEDGAQGFEISVWLHCDALDLNVSGLMDTLCVMLDVNSQVTEENIGTFDQLYAIARETGEESELLDSSLVLTPTVSGDGGAEESATPTVAGRYALTAPYAGEGLYRVVATEPE